MSKVKYTVPQKRAVFYGDGDLLLSAAAGSGKTASLTGRIVELIVSGRADISQMLIVTFTRAAAAEMKTRIRSALRDILSGGANDSPARGGASRAADGRKGARFDERNPRSFDERISHAPSGTRPPKHPPKGGSSGKKHR